MATAPTDRRRPQVILRQELVTVDPGKVAQVTLTVKNNSQRVAHLSLTPVANCVAAGWTDLIPNQLQLLSGDSKDVVIRFRPPHSSDVPEGRFPFGVHVTPTRTEDLLPVVAEGDIAIGAIHALEVVVEPIRPRGRIRGQFRIILRNKGTQAVRVEMEPTDTEEYRRLQFALADRSQTVNPGASPEMFLQVRPDRPQLLGQDKQHQFELRYSKQAEVRSAQGGPAELGPMAEDSIPATYVQKPIISRWMIRAMILGILLVVLFLIWRARTAPAELTQPPAAPDPANLVIQAATNQITYNFTAAPGVDRIQARQADCGSGANPKAPIGETDEQVINAGRAAGQVEHEVPDGQPICLQFRVFDDETASLWTEEAPVVGAAIRFSNVTPEVIPEAPGIISVTWGEPTTALPTDELQYVVYVNEVPVSEGQTERRWRNEDAIPSDGQTATSVFIEVTSPGGHSARSGTWSGVLDATGAVPPKQNWVVLNSRPADDPGIPTMGNTVEVIIRQVDDSALIDFDSQLKDGIVGTDVRLAGTIDGEPIDDAYPIEEGDWLHYLEGYPTFEAAQAACLRYNQVRSSPEVIEALAAGPVPTCVAVAAG